MIRLLSRASAILSRPRATWHAIASDRTSILALYAGYVVPLAAIGPLATFVALHVVGTRITRSIVFRASTAESVARAGLSFAYALAGVALLGAMLSLVGPLFGGRCSLARAVRIAAYAYTPAWLAGALLVFPPLRPVELVAVGYAMYLLTQGIGIVLAVPQPKALAYAALAIACAVAAAFGLGALTAALPLRT